MFDGHYEEWRGTRLYVAETLLGTEFFDKKNILEIGCGHAHIGRRFAENHPSSHITCVDGRLEHIEYIDNIVKENKIENIDTFVCDCDGEMEQFKDKKYDLSIHWGLLYHLKDPREHLNRFLRCTDYLLLECEVCDSEEICVYPINENGYDQALNKTGCRPSAAFIENCLNENEFDFQIVIHEALDSGGHKYSWKAANTNSYPSGYRRYWIAWRRGLDCKIADLESLNSYKEYFKK